MALLSNAIDLAPSTLTTSTHTFDREFAEPRINGLTQQQLVNRIITQNPTASATFLSCFDLPQLWAYLEHLDSASQPRGRNARPVCADGISGICWSDRRG